MCCRSRTTLVKLSAAGRCEWTADPMAGCCNTVAGAVWRVLCGPDGHLISWFPEREGNTFDIRTLAGGRVERWRDITGLPSSIYPHPFCWMDRDHLAAVWLATTPIGTKIYRISTAGQVVDTIPVPGSSLETDDFVADQFGVAASTTRLAFADYTITETPQGDIPQWALTYGPGRRHVMTDHAGQIIATLHENCSAFPDTNYSVWEEYARALGPDSLWCSVAATRSVDIVDPIDVAAMYPGVRVLDLDGTIVNRIGLPITIPNPPPYGYYTSTARLLSSAAGQVCYAVWIGQFADPSGSERPVHYLARMTASGVDWFREIGFAPESIAATAAGDVVIAGRSYGGWNGDPLHQPTWPTNHAEQNALMDSPPSVVFTRIERWSATQKLQWRQIGRDEHQSPQLLPGTRLVATPDDGVVVFGDAVSRRSKIQPV